MSRLSVYDLAWNRYMVLCLLTGIAVLFLLRGLGPCFVCRLSLHESLISLLFRLESLYGFCVRCWNRF